MNQNSAIYNSPNPITDIYNAVGVLPVQDVTLISSGQRTTINVSDFDATKHSNPTKPRQAPADEPNWIEDYHPELGTSIPIQVSLSGGGTSVIWSSQYNSSLHSSPMYMTTIETAAPYVSRMNQNGGPYTPTPPGPFAEPTRDLLGPTVAENIPSRALVAWPTAWQLPSLYQSPYEAGGGAAVLT